MPRLGAFLLGAIASLLLAQAAHASYPGVNGFIISGTQIYDPTSGSVQLWNLQTPSRFEADGWHVVHPKHIPPPGEHYEVRRTDLTRGLAGDTGDEIYQTGNTIEDVHRSPTQGLVTSENNNRIHTENGGDILIPDTSCSGYSKARWSPDGTKLAWYCFAPPIAGGSDLAVGPPDGSDHENLSNWFSGRMSGLDWKPDSTRVVYSGTSSGNDKIWTNNTAGTDEQEIYEADCEFCIQSVAWSPDGTKIAFGYNNGVVSFVAVMNANGTGEGTIGLDSSPSLDWGPGDATAPETILFPPLPVSLSNDASPDFSFIASDTQSGVDHVECSLDGAAFTPCTTDHSQSYTGVPDGPHTFDVQAVDHYGNADPSPAHHAWTIDTMPPTVSITFPDEGGRFSYFKDVIPVYSCGGPGLVSCVPSSNPLDRSSLGPNTFTVTATDAAGNTATASRHYSIFTFAGLILDDHPIAYFRLGDGLGSQTMTALAGQNGEYKNSQESEPFGVTGDGNEARLFIGRDGYGYANGVKAPSGPFTMAAFVRPDTTDDGMVMQHGGAGALWVAGGVFHFRPVAARPAGEVSGGPALVPGTWHHVAGTYDGGRWARLYVDGALVATARASGRPSGASTLYIGYGDFVTWFHGAIDEPAYFPSQLSATHIHEQWMADPPPDGPAPRPDAVVASAPPVAVHAAGGSRLLVTIRASRAGRLTGRIMRHGRIVARVSVTVHRGIQHVRLRPTRALRPGTYRLVLRLGRRTTSVSFRVR